MTPNKAVHSTASPPALRAPKELLQVTKVRSMSLCGFQKRGELIVESVSLALESLKPAFFAAFIKAGEDGFVVFDLVGDHVPEDACERFAPKMRSEPSSRVTICAKEHGALSRSARGLAGRPAARRSNEDREGRDD